MSRPPLPPHTHDFDFLHGSWTITNRRLASRLTGSEDWVTFTATAECHPILGGLGNTDDFRSADPGWEEFEGGSIRIFDPARDQWAIWWMDNVRCSVFPPVFGRFADGVGEFLGTDTEGDVPVLARYRWTGLSSASPRWEQAFSTDDGATWETNWTMRFTRRE